MRSGLRVWLCHFLAVRNRILVVRPKSIFDFALEMETFLPLPFPPTALHSFLWCYDWTMAFKKELLCGGMGLPRKVLNRGTHSCSGPVLFSPIASPAIWVEHKVITITSAAILGSEANLRMNIKHKGCQSRERKSMSSWWLIGGFIQIADCLHLNSLTCELN